MNRDEIEKAMDDPSEWGDPLPPKRRSERRQRHAMISIRLSSQELEQLQWAADFRGITISKYVREQALKGSSRCVKINGQVVE